MDLYLNDDIPSMNNIYSSTYWDKVKEDEQSRSNKLYEKAKNPLKTGVIAKAANSDMFSRVKYNEIMFDNEISSLTGEKMKATDFAHNNMTPFLRKNITQNTNIENMSPYLDNLTGNNQYWQNKKEVKAIFKPEANSGGNICGMRNNDDFIKSRIDVSEKVNNFFPIESIKVGPGLNKGYGSSSSGGFHQGDTNEYAKPRSLDELRSKINQKQTYFEIPVKGHIKGTDQRPIVSPFAKQRPDTVYEQSQDMWLKTTGAYNKETLRPSQNVRPTTRPESHVEYSGSIAKNNYNIGEDDDYGKSKIMVYNTERQLTETRTVVSNVTSLIKAVVSPIMDALKYTMKEYTVESARAVGNPSIQIPEKSTLYDPVNHIMKTTVKETTLHDTENANLSGNKETYSALNDLAKTTIKETTIHDSENTNLSGNKETYSALNDLAKTTIKETTVHDCENNNLSGSKQTYSALNDLAKTTVKETTVHDSENTNLSGSKETYSALNDLAKTTVKETTVHDSENNNLSGNKETYSALNDLAKTTVKETTVHDSENNNLSGSKQTYSALNDLAKTTVKETTVHDSENNNLSGSKQTYSALNDLAKTTVKETLLHDGILSNIRANEHGYVTSDDKANITLRQTMPVIDSVRNIGGTTYKVSVYDPDIVAKTTTKQTTIIGKSEYGFIGGVIEGLFGAYLNSDVKLKNTHKQFLSNTSDYGIAGSSSEFRQSDRYAAENAEIDGTRETMLIEAGHTPNPGNMNINIDSSEIEMSSRKAFENSVSARDTGNIGMIYQTSPNMTNCSITKTPNKSNAYTNRLDSDLLVSINKNEFMATQRINPIKKGCTL